MSKIDKQAAYTKGAKKRRKKARITLPGGEIAPQRPAGRDRRHTNQPDNEPPPIHKARAARCKGSTLHESDMGRCILALSEGRERADLAEAWADLSAARRNYLMRIIGQTGDPPGAASPMLTDTMETDPSLRVDLRSPGEKDEAAGRRWLEWCGRIETLPVPQMKWALRGALDGFMGDGSLWRDGAPTRSGLAAVQALNLLTNRQ
jgi:hypothetical protein